jgi:DNA-3-methyladenine glycosylase
MNELAFLNGTAEEVAPRLLGCLLVRELNGRTLSGKIVETEAYDQIDAASHSYKGQTPRTEVMFGPSGHAYVYFTYGMHYCMNIVTGATGYGSAVLIRAIEPLEGEDMMSENRGDKQGIEITNGPAKLCQALAIDKAWNGHDLHEAPLQLILKPAVPSELIVRTTRIGISQAQDTPWRFYIKDSPYVSRP